MTETSERERAQSPNECDETERELFPDELREKEKYSLMRMKVEKVSNIQ